MKYRPSIDGLRAVAVLSVCIFHLDHDWLPGGFIGVDIFFVISGYLISKIIASSVEEGSFSLAIFYQRRIARILPAFLLTALITLGVSKFIYTPQDFASAGATFTAAMLSVVNMKYMLQGTYFEVSPDAQPFLHYWSLAVEEQFYIFYPILYYAIHKYAKLYLRLILVILFTVSFIACIATTIIKPTWAFYLLPTRAWELLAGSLLAIWTLANRERANGRYEERLSLICLGLLILSLIFIRESNSFPGYIALLPVFCTTAILFTSAHQNGRCHEILSFYPLPIIGRVSFSLYLWHWPVYSLVDYYMYASSPEYARTGAKIALTTLFTFASYRFVENPARALLNRPSKAFPAYTILILSIVICVPLGIVIRKDNYVNADPAGVAAGGIHFQSTPTTGSVVLMGDSNGSMYGKVIRDICRQLSCSLNVISVAAGDPLPVERGQSNKLWTDSLGFVQQSRPDVLIMAYAWTAKLKDREGALDMALNALTPLAGSIIILNQPATLPPNASRAAIRSGAQSVFIEEEASRRNRVQMNKLLDSKINTKISVVNVSEKFENANLEIIFTDEFGRQMYHDATHISGFGADAIKEVLSQSIAARLPKTQK